MKGQYDIILVLVNALLTLTIVIAMIGIVNALILSVVEARDRPHPGGGRHLGSGAVGHPLGGADHRRLRPGGSVGRGRVRLGAGPRPVGGGLPGVRRPRRPARRLRRGDGGAAWRPRCLPAALERAPPGPAPPSPIPDHMGSWRSTPRPCPRCVRRGASPRHPHDLATRRQPRSTPVGFTWGSSSGLVRIISWASSRKVEPGRGGQASVCQVDGGRWLTFEGPAQVTDDPARVAEAVRRYAQRYRQPGERHDRVAIEIVDRVLGGRDGRLGGPRWPASWGSPRGIGWACWPHPTGSPSPTCPMAWRCARRRGGGSGSSCRSTPSGATSSGGFRR